MKCHGLKLLSAAAALLSAAVGLADVPATAPVDPGLPVYQRVNGLTGKITLIGSKTMSELVSVWGEGFRTLYPEVQLDVIVEGSGNAVSSVIDGKATIGMLSRQINETEVQAFQKAFGYLPTVLTPAYEPIAIFVHKDNPIQSISLQQLDAVFSTTLKRGSSKPVTTWGDLGLAGQWAAAPIICEGRTPTTGSQVFFQAGILGGGEFRKDMVSNASNLGIVQAIAAEPRAIGFVGAIHAIPGIKEVPLTLQPGGPLLTSDSMSYPLVRPLQIVLNNAPGQQMSAANVEFVKFIFSKSGQQMVVVHGFTPVTGAATNISLQAIGVSVLN